LIRSLVFLIINYISSSYCQLRLCDQTGRHSQSWVLPSLQTSVGS